MRTHKAKRFPFRLRPAGAVALSLLAGTGVRAAEPALMAEVEFNDLFLQQPGGSRIDFSRFNKGNVTLAGSYRADLHVNQAWLGRVEIVLRQVGADSRNVQPCFDRTLLERIGVDLTRLTPEATARLDAGADCTVLSDLVPSATAVFDSGELRLDVSIPQIAMSRHARGYVDPRFWDNGVTAATLQYNANVYRTENQGYSATQGYLGLYAGFNIGPWRLRHSGNLTHNPESGNHYQSVQTNIQRAIAPIRSQLLIGDAFTDGAMFDSVGFRGVQLASDDRMYPESQRGYAPTIHGIANSNARVQIRQNGNILYETTVAAGAFEINDLYPTGYGGDLEVAVTEADGTVHLSRVPYAPVVNALRPGFTRYSVTAGQYRNTSVDSAPLMVQATVQHGFTNMLTGYGGMAMAEGYMTGVAGMALTTDWGAFGADITQSVTRLRNQPDRQGQSVRLTYSKLVEPTNTNLTLAAYRYSSQGYLSLADAVALRDLESRHLEHGMAGIQRGRLQITVNQNLAPGYGSFYFSGSAQSYWNRDDADTQFQFGYNNHYKRLSYGISASRQYNVSASQWDSRVMLTLGIALGNGVHAPYAMTNVDTSSGGATNVQQAVTGALGEDNAFSYGLNAGYSGGGATRDTTSVGANVSYASPVATLTASTSKSSAYSQFGAGIAGGIVAYGGGVAFTPTMGDTVAIVEASDAAGARVANGSGLRVDPWGHAVVPSLTPFAANQIEIDPKGLPLNVEMQSTVQRVAPTSGAVVRVKFETAHGGRVAILRARTADGEPVPFGAEVFDAQGHLLGTVAQGGRVIVRGLTADAGRLTARWGDGADSTCTLDYATPGDSNTASVAQHLLESQCTR